MSIVHLRRGCKKRQERRMRIYLSFLSLFSPYVTAVLCLWYCSTPTQVQQYSQFGTAVFCIGTSTKQAYVTLDFYQ